MKESSDMKDDTETKDKETKDKETKDTTTGKILKDKTGAKYKVTKSSEKNGTVSYVSPENGIKGTVTIPATIKVSGITYKVTSIKANAFKENNKITKVMIEKNAFSDCKKLKNITIKSTKLTKKNVGNNAFAETAKNAVVKVPSKKLKLYKSLFQSKGIDKKAKFKKI